MSDTEDRNLPEVVVLILQDGGTYNTSGDIAGEIWDNADGEMDGAAVAEWMMDNGYTRSGTEGFWGWGEVWRHLETGERLSVSYSEDYACPGCGCSPGDGYTAGCQHPDGCGILNPRDPLLAAARLREARSKGENLLVPPIALGRTLATPGALAALAAAIAPYLDETERPHGAQALAGRLFSRHEAGDYGTIPTEDFIANEAALLDGSRVISQYPLRGGERVWLITEADRSSTTILLPEEY